MNGVPIIVAGGGIGGLAVALGFAHKGFQVVVLERAPRLGEIGAGIQLGPNAFHAFDTLGVGEAARKIAVYIDRLRLMDAIAGDEIASIDLTEPFRQRFGNPYAVVHRGEIHGVFLRACEAHPGVDLRTGSEVVGYDQDDRSVSAILSTGERVTGSILVGADGLHSRVRAQMLNDGPPRVPGHTTYRSIIPLEQMPEDLRWNAATLWAGERCHLVHYPLSDWKVFNLAITTHNDPAELVAGKPVSHEEVMVGFRGIHPRAQAIIQHGRDWKAWVICDRDPVDRWRDGRVVLLGDAAHPMLQYFAQGACMALEDAVCLSNEMSGHCEEPVLALKSYQDKRILRTTRVQLSSRALGEHVYHPRGSHARLRDHLLRTRTTEEFYESLAWLYGVPGWAPKSRALPRPNLPSNN